MPWTQLLPQSDASVGAVTLAKAIQSTIAFILAVILSVALEDRSVLKVVQS